VHLVYVFIFITIEKALHDWIVTRCTLIQLCVVGTTVKLFEITF